MTILFAGGEMGAFTPSDGASVESTSADVYDSSLSRCALRIGAVGSTASYIESAHFSATSSVWLHFVLYTAGPPSDGFQPGSVYNAVSLIDDSDAEVFFIGYQALTQGAPTTISLHYNGAQTGTPFDISNSVLQTIDLFVSDSLVSIYVAGTLRDTISGSFPDIANIAYFRFNNIYNTSYYSQAIVSTLPTISYQVKTLPIDGNGATQEWTGDYTDVAEIVYDDGSFIYSGTADQVSTYTTPDNLPADTRAVVVTARALASPAGPQNLQLAVRVSGTNYFSSTVALMTGFGADLGIWETDPSTALPWGEVPIEYGVKSIT
jgi:hypothetical protein